MKAHILCLLTTILPATTPADVLKSLDRFPGLSPLQITLHVESQMENFSKPNEAIKSTRQDFGVRMENGELWTQKTPTSDDVSEHDLQQILDPRPLIRTWMAHEPLSASAVKEGDPLVFTIKPETPARLKRLWESEGRLQVWLSKDGIPSHALLLQRYKGRTQRIAPTQEVLFQVDYTFQVEGDHLVVSRMNESREAHDGYEVTKHRRIFEFRNQTARP